MNVIFLCENPQLFASVYAKEVIEKLQKQATIDPHVYTKAELLAAPQKFSQTQVIFSTWGMPSLTEAEIETCFPALECVFYAAGTVQSFARPFLRRGIQVFSAWAANAVPVAEYTVAQIILAGKDFYCQTRLLSQKRLADAQKRDAGCFGNFRQKIGLIGCGMIGSLVAQMLKNYDLEVLAFDPFMSPEKAKQLGVTPCTLEELFATCSVVSNHLANNAETQRMLQYKHFASMPPYAVFLNTGRGAQVIEEDLVRALTERPDLTAVLDVTHPEPSPLDHPFYSLPNCFLTPHIAGSKGGEVVRMAEYMVGEYEKYVAGQPTAYAVTMKMLETMA